MIDLESLDRMITLTEVAGDRVRALAPQEAAATADAVDALFECPEAPAASLLERRLQAISGGYLANLARVDGAVPLVDAVERLLVALRDLDQPTRAAIEASAAADGFSADAHGATSPIEPAATVLGLREALRRLYRDEILELMEI